MFITIVFPLIGEIYFNVWVLNNGNVVDKFNRNKQYLWKTISKHRVGKNEWNIKCRVVYILITSLPNISISASARVHWSVT